MTHMVGTPLRSTWWAIRRIFRCTQELILKHEGANEPGIFFTECLHCISSKKLTCVTIKLVLPKIMLCLIALLSKSRLLNTLVSSLIADETRKAGSEHQYQHFIHTDKISQTASNSVCRLDPPQGNILRSLYGITTWPVGMVRLLISLLLISVNILNSSHSEPTSCLYSYVDTRSIDIYVWIAWN